MRHIVFIAFDGVVPLDLVGPLQVFETASGVVALGGGVPAYRVSVASPEGGEIAAAGGLRFITGPLADLDDIDTIVVPGGQADAAMCSPKITGWLANRAPLTRRICSVCVGAFALGHSGLLRNRVATTHWASCDRFRDTFPDVRVASNRLFVSDGPIWTSAGVSAGIDLALRLVEDDLGRAIAAKVSEALVLYMRRGGREAQVSSALAFQNADDPQFSELSHWMIHNLASDLSIEALAGRCSMSSRTFARRFRTATGITPGAAVQSLRVDAARHLLAEGEKSVKAIAAACGFRNAQSMRRAFDRALALSPGTYRRLATTEQSG